MSHGMMVIIFQNVCFLYNQAAPVEDFLMQLKSARASGRTNKLSAILI